MNSKISQSEARNLATKLQQAPVAPGRGYSHLINVGTEHILDSLEENYFNFALEEGIGCFKYLEGYYGSGKTQFIQNLARRASNNDIVTSLVTVGADCPFNSPSAIFRSIMGNFQSTHDGTGEEDKGIEVLIDSWIKNRIRELGAEDGDEVPDEIQREIEIQFDNLWRGPPDQQMATALRKLSLRLLNIACGAGFTDLDSELIEWVRGDKVRSVNLRKSGLFEPALDDNAFKRLKTVIKFLRRQMGFKGFLIAFDEGTRTNSFRRGTIKQRQSIENMLTMINENTLSDFGGVMFLYSATPDFRNEIIGDYRALQDRIGNESHSEGSPLVPLIRIDDVTSSEMLLKMGERLLEIYKIAYGIEWDIEQQLENLRTVVEAHETIFVELLPRNFIYQYCRFLNLQRQEQRSVSYENAEIFVTENELPEDE